MNDKAEELLRNINNNEETLGVIGMGYVGLPLAVTFASKGVRVIGFDKSRQKCDLIEKGNSYIADVAEEDLQNVVANKCLRATTDMEQISQCDALIICVPTPLDRFKKPDMSYIESACKEIGSHMKSGCFITLESTTYPTTTEDFVLPILEKESSMKHGEDFWLAFSPERVDPGNKEYKTDNTPKVFGAMTEEGNIIGKALYEKAINHLHMVSSPKVAEMVKILENTYRLINISMINELALLAGRMDINIWEVIEAAKTKPYGFQAFYPGPGVGGHCIPLDPFYLEYIAKKYDFDLSMIHTAGHIDTLMPHRMMIKINTALNRHKKSINGSKVLFLGVAYKPDINDERESPALKIIDQVDHKGAIVMYHDPFIEKIKTENGVELESCSFDVIDTADVVVITTNHSCFNGDEIASRAKLVVDLRNVVKEASDKVYKL